MKLLFFLLFFCLNAFCDENPELLKPDSNPKNTPQDSIKLHPWRFAGFTTFAVVSTSTLFYTFLRVAWWDKEQSDFFFNDDLEYALNIDKVAHFYGGYGIASMVADGFLWSGVSPHWSYGSAWAFSTMVQGAIDLKDGYTPGFGFSKWDVIAGSAGAALPWIEYSIFGHDQKEVDLKFSYYKNNNVYYEKFGVSHGLDEYVNQTYWVTWYPQIRSMEYWKRIWGVSMGFSIDEGTLTRGKGRGQWEIYLAADYNLEEIFQVQTWDPFWRGCIRYLNHSKLPAPTLVLYPELEVQWMYPIRF